MRVWLVGANGFIGRSLRKSLESHNFEVATTSTSGERADFELNLLHIEGFDFNNLSQGDVLILLASISSPETCELEPETAKQVNVIGASKLIETCLSLGVRVLFASSDTVYGDAPEPVKEDVACLPKGNYAKMKREVELKFHGNPNFVSIRLSYVVGEDDKLTSYLVNQSAKNESAELYSQIARSAVSISDVTEGLSILCRKWPTNSQMRIINFGGPESLTRLKIAQYILQNQGLKVSLLEVPPPKDFFDVRPKVVNLNIDKFSTVLGRLPKKLQCLQIEELN